MKLATRTTARDTRKAKHRLEIIDAAIDAIAEKGLTGASVGEITTRAGLSRGMVNLHFQTKQQLLLETASHLNAIYRNHWETAAHGAGDAPADRLWAMIAADFDPVILNHRHLSVWFSLRAQSRLSDELRALVDTRDRAFVSAFVAACRDLIEAGPYPELNARHAALGMIALLEGMWTDFLLHPDRFDRAEATATCRSFLRALFPNHFSATVPS